MISLEVKCVDQTLMDTFQPASWSLNEQYLKNVNKQAWPRLDKSALESNCSILYTEWYLSVYALRSLYETQ